MATLSPRRLSLLAILWSFLMPSRLLAVCGSFFAAFFLVPISIVWWELSYSRGDETWSGICGLVVSLFMIPELLFVVNWPTPAAEEDATPVSKPSFLSCIARGSASGGCGAVMIFAIWYWVGPPIDYNLSLVILGLSTLIVSYTVTLTEVSGFSNSV